MDRLFREEVVAARNQKWLGEILLARPVSLQVLTLLAAVIAAGIVAFLFLGEYTRKERVTGQLALNKGVVKVYSQTSGVVVRRMVREGDRVAHGQPLYVISVERNTAAAGEIQAEIIKRIRSRKASTQGELEKQKEILKLEERQLRQKIADLEAELSQLGREIATQERRLGVSKDIAARYQKLLHDNFVSPAQRDEKEQEFLDQQGKLEGLRRLELSARRELNFLTTDLANLPLKAANALAAIERVVASIEQEILDNEVKRETVVVALQEGVVTAVLADLGQAVSPALPLLSILPRDAELEASLNVPSRAVGFVEVGNRVLMRYQAYPYQKFGQYPGTVREIAKTALKPEELKLVGTPEETYYRMIVALDSPYVTAYGRRIALQDGMQLEVDILLDTRKLYEWVLEPLYSISGKL